VNKLALLAVSICALFSTQLLADQVSLKNGDRLSGTIVKSDEKTLVLHTDYAGDVNVNWSAIQSIQSAEDLHVKLQDGRTVVGPVSGSNEHLQIATKSGAVDTDLSSVKGLRNNAEETAYEKTLHPGLLQEWKTGLNVGYSLTRGNSRTSNLALGYIGTRQTLHDKLGLYANAVYAKSTVTTIFAGPPTTTSTVTTTTANTAGGGARYDHDLKPRLFAFTQADFFADALQGLNLRSVFGGGAGFHAIKNDNTTLDLLGGLNYTRESYTTLSRNFAALTLGEELMHKLGKSTVLNEKLYFFPDLNSPGDFRGTFDFGTVTKLNKWLGWQNAFSDVYVTNPPPTKKQNDIILTTGLNVSWGQ
jgi:putative salt-induced outer membrane protein YdiY